MSNFLAIATVTGTLRSVLAEAASVVAGAVVTTRRPDGAAGANQGAGINIFLYQVTPNAAYRNEDLPTRRGDGRLVQRPRVALELHYLLSFFGDDKALEPQRLLGAAVRQLHTQPQLARQQIENTLSAAPFLGQSNLAEQLDRVRFTPQGLSIDELSKVWSVFFQSPYLLSIAYVASAVLIEAEDTPSTSLPVLTRTIEVMPIRQPIIDAVMAEAGDGFPILSASLLRIRGKRLSSDALQVLLDGIAQPVTSVGETEVTLSIPAGTQAGPHSVQVVHQILLGVEPNKTAHRGLESNVASFILQPGVTATNKTPLADGTTPGLSVATDTPLSSTQRALVLLDGVTTPSPGSFSLTPESEGGTSTTALVDISHVPAGTYFVRLQIEGASSPVDLDPASATFGPTVTLP